MNRWIFAACLMASLATGSARADEGKDKTDLNQYLQQLQLKLDHAAQRANQPAAGGSSVVGVRGSPQEPLSQQLYWKGKKTSTPVTTEQVKLMREAVELARTGQTRDAVTALKAFEARYPSSPLKADADETLRRLGELPVPAAKS